MVTTSKASWTNKTEERLGGAGGRTVLPPLPFYLTVSFAEPTLACMLPAPSVA